MNETELKAIPTFRILDYGKAMKFYIGFLGFCIDWEHRFGQAEPVYMQISKNGLLLHLSENERFTPGSVVFVETNGLPDLHKQLKEKDPSKIPGELTQTNWKTLQLEIQDPFGNLLRFNESSVR